jgi:hypothetical protein
MMIGVGAERSSHGVLYTNLRRKTRMSMSSSIRTNAGYTSM